MIIKAENLTKTYSYGSNRFVALKKVGFEIEKGDFVAITGRSGSGKSTLLYQLSLLDKPDKGEIEVLGINLKRIDEKSLSDFRLNNFGFVFQDYALLPTLSALENVMLPLLMLGNSQRFTKERAEIVLTEVGLKEKKSSLPSQLSGGEQQRVSIARAFAHNPQIIFADEPTANLDSKTSWRVLNLFKQLNLKGITIVLVTHETSYTNLARRVITLSDGEIVTDKRLGFKVE
jgi:putative ABC transport system ATP-binding protein